jgi:hypothetical protein
MIPPPDISKPASVLTKPRALIAVKDPFIAGLSLLSQIPFRRLLAILNGFVPLYTNVTL